MIVLCFLKIVEKSLTRSLEYVSFRCICSIIVQLIKFNITKQLTQKPDKRREIVISILKILLTRMDVTGRNPVEWVA